MRNTHLIASCTAVALACGSCADHDSNRTGGAVVTALNVVFETRSLIETGVSGTTDVALADFTGDGILDLAVIDRGETTGIGAMKLLVGQGGGVFADGGSTPISVQGSEIRAADLDLDGDLDLAIASYASDTVDILVNLGAGVFTGNPPFATQPVPTSMVAQDCNDDGIPDLLLTHFSPSFVEVFLGNGDGTFGPSMNLPAPAAGEMAGLSVGDVNRDGNTDILLADTDNNELVMFLGSAGGLHDVQQTFPVGSVPFGVAIGDVTGDAKPDIVVTSAGDKKVQVISHAAGFDTFLVRDEFVVDGKPGLVTIGDFTGDGMPDVATAMVDTKSVTLLEGTATGLANETRFGATGNPYRPIAADINGDGRLDLLATAVGTSVLNLYLGRDVGLAGSRQYDASVEEPAMVDVADLDGDGIEDLAVGGLGESFITVLGADVRADGTGDLTALPERYRIDVSDAVSPRRIYDVVAHDVNRDGRIDLVAAVDGGVKVCVNRSVPGTFSFDVVPQDDVFAAGAEARRVAVADLNRDGLEDLVVASFPSSDVRFVPGVAGAGKIDFGTPVATTIPGGPGGLAIGSFDNDPQLELAVSLVSSARVHFYELDPAGNFVLFNEVLVGALPTRIDTADLSRDGRTDLVVSNGESDTLSILIGTASGYDTMEVPAGDGPTALLTRDVNRDGNDDIVVATLRGSEFRVLLGDGFGNIQQSLIFPALFAARTAAFIDLNGDTFEDLVIGGFAGGRVSVFKNLSR